MTASTVPRRAGHGRKNQRRLMQAIVAALCVPAGAAAAQDDAPKPSAIEHALVEYLCRSIQGPTMLGTEQYQSCYTAQLDALREPFGANLSKLTGAERKSLDAWCGPFQAARDRDAYLACLNRQLVRLKDQRAAKAKSAEAAAQAEVLESEPSAPAEAVAAVAAPPPPPAGSSGTLWLVLAIGGVASAGGTAFVMLRGKRTSHTTCRGCGAPVEGGGDMCANCRHEAAEARRRAIAERAEEERLQAETARREAERLDEDVRREQARRDEALRLAAEAEQQRRDDRDRRLQQAQAQHAAGDDAVFDPYAVLGLTPDATADQVRAAYQQAKAKYDASQYEHFGGELQAHFKAKAEAVERAFQMLYVSE